MRGSIASPLLFNKTVVTVEMVITGINQIFYVHVKKHYGKSLRFHQCSRVRIKNFIVAVWLLVALL